MGEAKSHGRRVRLGEEADYIMENQDAVEAKDSKLSYLVQKQPPGTDPADHSPDPGSALHPRANIGSQNLLKLQCFFPTCQQL